MIEIFNVMTKDEQPSGKTHKKDQIMKPLKTDSNISNGKSDIDRKTIRAIAAKAKKMRNEMKVGYEQFALQAGINRNSYYRFERAASTGENFTIGLLLKVIKGLNIPVSEFFKTIK